jgi:hypothetical protein
MYTTEIINIKIAPISVLARIANPIQKGDEPLPYYIWYPQSTSSPTKPISKAPKKKEKPPIPLYKPRALQRERLDIRIHGNHHLDVISHES